MDQYTSDFVKTLFRSAFTSTWPYNSPHSDHGSRGGGEHLPPGHRHSHQRAPKRWEKDSLHSHKSVYLVIETFGGVNCVCVPSFLCPQSGEGMQQSKQQSRSYWESFLCKVRAYILIIGLIYDIVAFLTYIRPVFYISFTSWHWWTVGRLLQLIATALTGRLAQFVSVFPFNLVSRRQLVWFSLMSSYVLGLSMNHNILKMPSDTPRSVSVKMCMNHLRS